MNRFKTLFIWLLSPWLLLTSLTALANPLNLPGSGWQQAPEHPPVQVRLVQAGPYNAEQNHYPALLQVRLTDDWKTYWRSPGEGGIAPRLDWQASDNLADVNWQWPMPERFSLLGIETQGYQHEVDFPLQLTPSDTGQASTFNAQLTLPSCTTVCVLTDYQLQLPLDANWQVDEQLSHDYQQAVAKVPRVASLVSSETLTWDKASQQLEITLNNERGWQQPAIYVDELDEAIFSQPTFAINDQQLQVRFQVSSWDDELNLDQQAIVITAIDEGLAEELHANISAGTLAPLSENVPALGWILLYAVLGGLILNIMPCVLPVLGLKLNSLVLGERKQVRAPLLWSAFGIMLSFWLLAAFMLVLTWSGAQLGWGIQFQQPAFIGFMLLITALFSLNLFGLFEVRLPSSLNTWLATRPGHGNGGHVLQGMFATLLATPCSAPFLGTAVAVALASSPVVLVAIFTGLGLGMALPWLLLALFPSVIRALPKPGLWMEKVKWLFGLMLLATSLWLLSLLSYTLGAGITWALAALLIVLPIWSLIRQYGARGLMFGLAGMLLLGAVAGVGAMFTQSHWVSPIEDNLNWQPLDASRIAEEVAAGKRVFVDVTADWCITCQANKIGVTLRDPVYSALQADDIVLMRGDWTRPNSAITDYLHANQRAGIPFNQVFGPGLPQGKALEVLLTTNKVISALDEAKQ
ncbi:protein-disulfide reductase DsbD family protein [Oceanisphaera sp. IT1-181]|uniref:protein-disulfide reductase DsbD family protein n=1 Tax=Oceanisphaera sp. IT1-181 TaxID=3081199 RepID=UPI0029CA6EA4|nr:protein-disulfide reductase DsbD domain-containing protein [Oceanisphaera sp. IT1-181]